MAGGRPTDYDPKYCKQLIDHMAQGYSFESFAGKIDVCKKTLYNWTEQNEEFLHAKKRAIEKCRLFWEERGIKGLMVGKRFNATTWIFNMKNRFSDEWMDKIVRDDTAKIDANVNHTGDIQVKFGNDNTIYTPPKPTEDSQSDKP